MYWIWDLNISIGIGNRWNWNLNSIFEMFGCQMNWNLLPQPPPPPIQVETVRDKTVRVSEGLSDSGRNVAV
ncbi:hypothetical protein HanRHA438_Chr16g0756901 [Helianthus annuus]|nr:hypothetical protein HanRHA438_Chr16g0756901 [Helianthus annuus]